MSDITDRIAGIIGLEKYDDGTLVRWREKATGLILDSMWNPEMNDQDAFYALYAMLEKYPDHSFELRYLLLSNWQASFSWYKGCNQFTLSRFASTPAEAICQVILALAEREAWLAEPVMSRETNQ